MYYKGFGTDPNLLYSFRQNDLTTPATGSGQYADRFSALRGSLAYGQAGLEGEQRMERVVEKGLPAQTDINRIQKVGINPYTQRAIYAAPRPQAWGTWGALGSTQEPSGYKKSGGSQPAQRPSPAKVTEQPVPQPTRTPSPVGYIQSRSGIGFSRTPMGFTGEPASFTSGGQYFGMKPQPTATSTPTPFPELNTRNYFSGTMGKIKFPYAGY